MANNLIFTRIWLILSSGFAMFSMFFGSGNLVFPLDIGGASGTSFATATLGLLLTGVLVPFLGLIGIMTFKGNYSEFFAKMGGNMAWIIPLILLSLLGPFGAVPRCITVAHGSFSMISDSISLWQFSIAFCAIMFVLCLDKDKIVPIVGAVLTPALLVSLIAIIYQGIINASPPAISDITQADAFVNAITRGFMTMDLIAAFFFSSLVIYHIHQQLAKHQVSKKHENSIIIGALLVGAGILGSIYAAFVFLGASYVDMFAEATPEKYLAIIAFKTMGSYAAPILCCAVVLACLTTAVVLCSLFAEFIRKTLKIPQNYKFYTLFCSVILSFFVSTFEFKGIALILSPILDALYPALVVLTVLNIANRLWKFQHIKIPVWTTFAISSAKVIIDLI